MGKLQSKISDDKKSMGVLVHIAWQVPKTRSPAEVPEATVNRRASSPDSPSCVLLSLSYATCHQPPFQALS